MSKNAKVAGHLMSSVTNTSVLKKITAKLENSAEENNVREFNTDNFTLTIQEISIPV